MLSKTKNRRNRNKTKNRRNTRRQRGGNFWHTISLGLAGTPDAPSDTSSEPKQTWAEWAGISSDSKQSWAEWLGIQSTSAVDTDAYVPRPKPTTTDYATAPTDTSYTPPTTDTPTAESLLSNGNGQSIGGRKKSKSKSKSRRCSRKHKHSKSCYK
jgi:hypothetical protein